MDEYRDTEARGIRLGRMMAAPDAAAQVRDTPFPTPRLLRWLPRGYSPEPAPVAMLMSQEVLTEINAYVSQSLDKEMGGFLLGNRYRDPDSNKEFVIIDQHVDAAYAEGTAVSLAFTADAWMDLKENLSGRFSGKALVGWYHSHPKLGVFLSDSDLGIHEERFREPWMTAVVIDPYSHTGGFFCWRGGKLNLNEPVEFYEYLSTDSISTKESACEWNNYACYDDASGSIFEPRRRRTITALARPLPSGDRQVGEVVRWANRNVNLKSGWVWTAIVGLMFMIAGLVAFGYYFLLPSSPVTPIPSDPTRVPSKLISEQWGQAIDVLEAIELDGEKKFGPKVRRLTRSEPLNAPISGAGPFVLTPTGLPGDLQITLRAINVPGLGERARTLLANPNIQAKIDDRNAYVTFKPTGRDLEITLTAHIPDLTQQVSNSQQKQASFEIKFVDVREPQSPWAFWLTTAEADLVNLSRGVPGSGVKTPGPRRDVSEQAHGFKSPTAATGPDPQIHTQGEGGQFEVRDVDQRLTPEDAPGMAPGVERQKVQPGENAVKRAQPGEKGHTADKEVDKPLTTPSIPGLKKDNRENNESAPPTDLSRPDSSTKEKSRPPAKQVPPVNGAVTPGGNQNKKAQKKSPWWTHPFGKRKEQ